MPPVSYQLRAPWFWRLLSGIGLICVGFSLWSAATWLLTPGALAAAIDAYGLALVLATMAVLACVAAVATAVLVSAIVSPGRVVFGDSGVLFDTVMTQGFVAWSNVADAAIVPGFAGRYLAVRLNDPEAYTQMRHDSPDLRRYRHPSVSFGIPGLLLSLMPSLHKLINLLAKAFGYSPLPENLTETARMSWNERNYGFHVVIWKGVFPDAEEAVIGLAFGHRHTAKRMTTPSILKAS